MKKLIFLPLLSLLTLSSCAPKEQISVFDSNMLMRNAAETENIAKEIRENKDACLHNKAEMQRMSPQAK